MRRSNRRGWYLAGAICLLSLPLAGCDKVCGECGPPTGPSPSGPARLAQIWFEIWEPDSTGRAGPCTDTQGQPMTCGRMIMEIPGGSSGGRLDFPQAIPVSPRHSFVTRIDAREVFAGNQQNDRWFTLSVTGMDGTETRQNLTLAGGPHVMRFAHGFWPRLGDNLYRVRFVQGGGNLSTRPEDDVIYVKNVNVRAQ